jgi:hypothetical protein
MEFKVGYGNFFVFKIIMAVIFGGLGLLDFLSPISHTGFLQYKWVLETALSFLWILQIYRLIFLSVLKKPILTINERYLYDHNCKIRYWWKDIEEIYEKRGFLFIGLYCPKDYLDKIDEPIVRFVANLRFKLNRTKTLFFIHLETVEVDPNELLEILDDYSVKAINLER